MQKICWVCLLFFFIHLHAFAQGVWKDTLRTYVDLSHFNLGKKVVEAPYGRAIMYFSQKDYLGEEETADTVKVLPRFFKEYLMSKLMKEGKVRIIKRENDSVAVRISHRMVQCVSTVSRVFEFQDGTPFFQLLEITGLYGALVLDTSGSKEQSKITPKKDFKEPEEFPNLNDKEKIKFRDYFPIDTAINYVYSSDWDNYQDKDTIGCKEAIYEGQKIFYFPYEGYESYDLVDIQTTMFGEGIYIYRNDSLFIVEAEDESDLKPDTSGLLLFDVPHIKDARLLMPVYMTPGDSIVVYRGYDTDPIKKKQVYTYLTQHKIKIRDSIYKNCIKFKVINYSYLEITISYIWFCKGIGMVKWTRETGRTDELVNRYKH